MDRNDLTIQTYDQIAKKYQKLHSVFTAQIELDNFITYLKPGSLLLDAGCGFGRELKYLLDKGFEVYGFDPSSQLLKLAKENTPEAKLQIADLRKKLSYPDNFFDGIISKAVLHHLEEKDLIFALTEIKRILKPGGIFFFSWKEGNEAKITKEKMGAGKERFYNLKMQKEVEDLAKNAGFKIENAYTYDRSKRSKKYVEFPNFIAIFARK